VQEQEERRLLTISDVAAYLSIKEKTLYAKAAAGEIPHYKINYLIRFRLDEIDAWLDGCRQDKKTEVGQPKTKTKRRKTSGGSADHTDKMIAKIIDEVKSTSYTVTHGRSDQIEDLRKEVEHGSI